MSKDINIHVKTDGTEAAKQKIDGVGNSADKMGQKIEGAAASGQKAASKFDAIKNALGTLKAQILGVIGTITALIAILIKWEEHAQKTADAQKRLVDSTQGLDQAAKKYASQANIQDNPEMAEKGKQQILRIHEGAKLESMDQAGDIVSATHSAFGETGQLLTEDQEGIAVAIGNFARLKDIDNKAVGDLTKVLATMGVKNQKEAELRIQQLSKLQQKSKAQNFSEFIVGANKSLIPALSQGASAEFAMAGYSSALDVSASADIAAEMTKQSSAIMQNQSVINAIEQDMGLGTGTFRDMSFDQRKKLLGRWVSSNAAKGGAGQERMLQSGVSAEQMSVLMSLYGGGQSKRRDMFQGLALGTTPEEFPQMVEKWDKSPQGRREEIRSETDRIGSRATDDESVGVELFNRGEKIWENIEADGGNDPLYPDRYEKPRRTVWDPLNERLKRLRAARDRGELPDSVSEDLDHIDTFLKNELPIPGDVFTPGEAGKADRMLRGIEKQSTVNNIFNNNIYYTDGVDYNVQPPELHR